MKEVYATNNEVEIQMLVGLLESQGILAQVHADGAGGYLRVQGAAFNIFKRVVVRDEDWSRALSIAKENGFEKKKNTTKIDRTYVWAARITLVIFLVIILLGIFNGMMQ